MISFKEYLEEATVASLEKKIQTKQNQLELAREKRRMSGKSKGVQGDREFKLSSEISRLRQDLDLLKRKNESVDEAAPTKAAQFHGSDGTSVNVYARGDKHFAEIVNKTGSNVSASSVFPKGSNTDAQSKLDQVVLRSKKKDHKGALDILNTHSHIKFQHVTNEENVEEAIKGWKHAHGDLMKHRSEQGKEIALHALKKDGTESGMHDARKVFRTEQEARDHHEHMKKLNPGKNIQHNLYVGGKTEKLS